MLCRLHAADEPVQLGGGAGEAPLAGGGGSAAGGGGRARGASSPEYTGRCQLRREARDSSQVTQGHSLDRWVSEQYLVLYSS